MLKPSISKPLKVKVFDPDTKEFIRHAIVDDKTYLEVKSFKWFYDSEKNTIYTKRIRDGKRFKKYYLYRFTVLNNKKYFGVNKKTGLHIPIYFKTLDVFDCTPGNLTIYKFSSAEHKKNHKDIKHEIVEILQTSK